MDIHRFRSSCLALFCISFFCSFAFAAEFSSSADKNETAAVTWRNDLTGPVQGQIEFAQTHIVNVPRAIVDPLLVPGREALVMFTPQPLVGVSSVSLVVESQAGPITIAMTPPSGFPKNAEFDEENTYSGRHIVGGWPKFRDKAYTATIPWYLFNAENNLKFFINNDASRTGSLDKNKTTFMTNESEGLVLMNIKGCLFMTLVRCRVTLDQYDLSSNPELAKIAAREMFSELPVKQLVFAMGESDWPYIIAKGIDGVYRYSASSADRPYSFWAAYGDKTLPAKAGMGNYWRQASDLGDKQAGKFVAISGQLLDVPDDIPVLPPGVGASCGGSSCNYPSYPGGFWHETGHGLGLPHDSPPRYENWAYRSYDLRFLPHYHPDPHRYGLAVDYLGYHYFGHVLGSLGPPQAPQWPASTASAPLVDDFEILWASNPPAVAKWLHYVAPYTQQQTLRVQQRFGSFPPLLVYADINHDDRPAPNASPVAATEGTTTPALQAPIDGGIDAENHDMGIVAEVEKGDENPILKGVQVQTLVVSMAAQSPLNDMRRISQIYPPIVSNYGNVFKPAALQSTISNDQSPERVEGLHIESAYLSKCLTVNDNASVRYETCSGTNSKQIWLNPVDPSTEKFQMKSADDSRCLDADLRLTICSDELTHLWASREDLAGGNKAWKLQSALNGRFLTPESSGSVTLEALGGNEQIIFPLPQGTPFHNYVLHVAYADGSNEYWTLYTSHIPASELVTAAINVAVERKPVYAELIRDGAVIDHRFLDKQPSLPPPIIVGADAGYPTVIYQYLRSEETHKCLTRTPQGLTQEECAVGSAEQKWNLFDVLSLGGPHFVLAGETTAKCLSHEFTFDACPINNPNYQWSARKDLAHTGMVMLQNAADARFITADANGMISPSAFTGNKSQNFLALSPQELHPGVRIKALGTAQCIERVGEAVSAQPCSNDVTQQWRIGAIKNVPTDLGPYFALVSSDGSRCLLYGLKMAACDVGEADQQWSGRRDLTGSDQFKLQSLVTGTFLTTHAYGPLVMEGLSYDDHQLYDFQPF